MVATEPFPMSGPVPNGFTESWYVRVERELQEVKTLVQTTGCHREDVATLKAETKALQGDMGELKEEMDRISERQREHGNRLAMIATVGIIASLLIPVLGEIAVTHVESRSTPMVQTQ